MPSNDTEVSVGCSWLAAQVEEERAKALFFQEEEFNHALEAKYPSLTPTATYRAASSRLPRFASKAEFYVYLARRERAKYDDTVRL